eukprot:11518-Prymnesium_polylepis.1
MESVLSTSTLPWSSIAQIEAGLENEPRPEFAVDRTRTQRGLCACHSCPGFHALPMGPGLLQTHCFRC